MDMHHLGYMERLESILEVHRNETEIKLYVKYIVYQVWSWKDVARVMITLFNYKLLGQFMYILM